LRQARAQRAVADHHQAQRARCRQHRAQRAKASIRVAWSLTSCRRPTVPITKASGAKFQARRGFAGAPARKRSVSTPLSISRIFASRDADHAGAASAQVADTGT
jgi:hypothetical protein